MTGIRKITRLRHPGVLRNFAWPSDLPMFGRFNLIYGWNGSGKTTLSRIFRCIEQRVSPPEGQVTLQIDGADLAAPDFTTATLPVRVFNRDFVNESIFPFGGGDVPPIFVVGKESVEKQKEADRLKQEHAEAQSEVRSAQTRNNEAEHALDRYRQERARVIKDTLRSSGRNPFNNYNKSDFRSRAEQMVADDDAASYCLNDAERDTLLAQHKGTPKATLSEITYSLPDVQVLADEASALSQKTVVSAAIQSLKHDGEVASWTRRGLGLHYDRGADKCLFCEQMLPEGRLKALEAHFSAEYEQFMREIDDEITTMESIRSQTAALQLPGRAEFYGDIASEYEAAAAALRQALHAAGGFVESLGHALRTKRSKAFEALPVELTLPEIGNDVVDDVNAVIRKHNQASEDFEDRVSSARERLAMDLIAADIDEFKRLQNAAEYTLSESKAAKRKCDSLSAKMNEVENEIIEHRQPAEDLNNALRQYLGHGELQLTVKDTGYRITRNGESALMLSEGEMTAIALLYFLKSLEGRDFDMINGVVVLDDPVSSLDANALYLAFGLIRNRTESAGQLFVLTHNFQFFRQVRNWFHRQKGQNKKDINQRPSRFYMLDRVPGAEPRATAVRALDPLLEQYESEYHYLFACVHRAANATTEAGLEGSYSLPNVARRLLEMFLAFRQPQIPGELWRKLKDLRFDEARKLRIVRFLHTHSHGDTLGEPEHDPSVLGEARAVLADLLELMKSEDAQHFAAMESLVSARFDGTGSG